MASLRPLERRILRLVADGVDSAEIARRFKRSPGHVDRVAQWARLPGRRAAAPRTGLRPLERRILDMRHTGMDHGEIARRFRRGEGHIRRVEGMAHFKLAWELLGS